MNGWTVVIQLVVLLLGGGVGGGGIWFVVRQMFRYQKDFTDRYAEDNRHLVVEVAEQRVQTNAAQAEARTAREETARCERHREEDRERMTAMEAEMRELKATVSTRRSSDKNGD